MPSSHTLDLNDFYEQRFTTDLAVSPDGERVAFLSTEFDGAADERRQSLYVAPTDGSAQPHRLTRASDAQLPKWGPYGAKLGFVGTREDNTRSLGRPSEADDDESSTDTKPSEEDNGTNAPGDKPKPQVWVFDLDRGGDARQVTIRDEGVTEFDWGPTGDRIVIASRDPTADESEYLTQRREENGPIETTRLQHKRDGSGWLDSVITYLFVIEVETGESTKLKEAYGAGSLEPLYGLQPRWGSSDRIAFISSRSEWPDNCHVMDVCTIAPDGHDLRVLTDNELQASSPRWSPGGKHLAFNAGNPENWYETTEAYVADVEMGTYKSVSATLDRPVPFQGCAEWIDEETLLCPIGDMGRTRLVELDPTRDNPTRVFDGQSDYQSITNFDLNGGTVGVSMTAPDQPAEVFTLKAADLSSDSVTQVSNVSGAFTERFNMPNCRRITFENSNGDEIEGIVYLPAEFETENPEPRPLIASIHGGPMAYDSPEFDFDYHYWTDQGYVILRTNYRGSTSYGQSFSEVIEADWGQREADDIQSGVTELFDRGWADPDRAFVTGFSYGGIMTVQLLTRTDMFAAGAAEHGIYDLRSVFGTNDSHPWHESELGLPWENEEGYRRMSSIQRVGNIDTPLLVTAGGQDWRCPPSQAEQLYVSVRKQGVDAKLVIYPEENHNIGSPDRATHRLETIIDWFEEHDPASSVFS